MKYRFINDHRHEFTVATMCRVLRVSRGGFYQWVHKPLSERDIEDQRLLGMIRDSYISSGGVYGARRVFGDLREAGETCGKHRVEKIMRAHQIKAIRGYKRPRHIVGRPSIVAPNRLERHRSALAPGGHLAQHASAWKLLGCLVNAVAKSFFSSLKKERIQKRVYETRDLARADVFDHIEVFYNRNRRHSHLGGVSPEAFERASA